MSVTLNMNRVRGGEISYTPEGGIEKMPDQQKLVVIKPEVDLVDVSGRWDGDGGGIQV